MEFSRDMKFTTLDPGCCGIVFALQADQLESLKKTHKGFWCPSCGSSRAYREAETREQRELREAKERAALAERQAAAALAASHSVNRQLQKMRVRIRQGFCPCCDQKFQSLAEHMQLKHPDFQQHDLLRIFRESYGMTQAQLAEQTGITTAHQVGLFENGKACSQNTKHRLSVWLASQLT